MSAVLVAICLGMTFIASRVTYWIFKVFVGFFWWGLAFYWTQLPASADPSLQTILVILPIFMGLACFFWAFWYTSPKIDNGVEKSSFKLPFMNNEEENPNTMSNRVDRLNYYNRRVSNARRGIRERLSK